MKEEKLLNNTLDIIKESGTNEAYDYLVYRIEKLDKKSSQVYNYLYCLAASSDKTEEALDWIKEAVEIEGYWYRPEVFEDEDLDSVREDDRFKKYVEISNKRFQKAEEKSETLYTWKGKEKENILVVLHGNQQSNEISKSYWSDIKLNDYQVEYIQSKEIDSYRLYRWEDNGDGPAQIINTLKKSNWQDYNKKVLSGFSAGCNTILRTLTQTEITCEKIILISPWIPYIEENTEMIINNLLDKDVEVLIICGKEDQDCLSQCKLFESKGKELGLKLKSIYIDNLGHEYPENFLDMVGDFLV
jgi:predicted esterase